MEDTEDRDRTLEGHLFAGSAAVNAILANYPAAGPQPVCHHFSEQIPIDPIHISMVETYTPLVPQFAALGIEFLPDRLEAWETVEPDLTWLSSRVPLVFNAALESSLIYDGWTWEPRDLQFMGTTTFPVVDNRTR